MRIEVTVQAYDDLSEGTPVVWGYRHEEQIPQDLADVDFFAIIKGERKPTTEEGDILAETESRNAGRILEEITKRVEEARVSIIEQAAAGLPHRGD